MNCLFPVPKYMRMQVVEKDMREEKQVVSLLIKGVQEGIYPGAVLLAAQGSKIVFFQEVGRSSLEPHSVSLNRDIIFDLASLTKPLATTLSMMRLVDEKKIYLDQPLISIFPKSVPRDKWNITPRLLLSHCAGFTDWRPFYLELVKYRMEKRKTLVRYWIMDSPLSQPPGQAYTYSDLGFIILEWVIEKAAGMPMSQYVKQNFYDPLSLRNTFLAEEDTLARFDKYIFAATEKCLWRKDVIQGQVHDENAFALGGYSGHAGLFSTANEVYILVNLLRAHYMGIRNDFLRPETVREFFARQNKTAGCTCALGWDTPSHENSSAGRYLSHTSVGHLGFTGTSVWMDLERDVIIVFLTNRIHPTRQNEKIREFRPLIHDTVMEKLISI